MFLCTARCTVQESTVLSLCTVSLCERELNFCHLAARCTTASRGPLRRDFSLMHESTPPTSYHKSGRGRAGRFLKAFSKLSESSSSRSFFAPCQTAGHFELPRRVFPTDWGWARGIQKRKISFLDVMPSSHTPLDHGGKQAAKKRISRCRLLLISHVSFRVKRILVVRRAFCCFSCGSHRNIPTEMLLVCGEDSNRFRQLHSWKLSFLLWNLDRDCASFHSAVISWNDSIIQLKLLKCFRHYIYVLTISANNRIRISR